MPAIKFALSQKPDAVYIITDGGVPDEAEFRRRLLQLNLEKRLTINVILTAERGDPAEIIAATRLLKRIAADHLGTFRVARSKQ